MKPKLIKDLGVFGIKSLRYGLYECPYCKKEFKTRISSVETKNTTKCKSCATKLSKTKHGQYKTKLYSCWLNMKQRCLNENHQAYNLYGKRDIKICNEWIDSFELFNEWALNNGYKTGLEIDRIDNNGNYEPSNCRWTNREVQTRNTRRLLPHNKSGYRGVSIDKERNLWKSQITINNKNIFIARSTTKYRAAYIRDMFVVKNSLEHTLNFTRMREKYGTTR